MSDNEFVLTVRIDGEQAEAEASRLRDAIAAQISRITVEGEVEIQGLERARDLMRSLRGDAGTLGRAIAAGLGQQWETLEQRLSAIQSRISGIVHQGQTSNFAEGLLGEMPEYEAALSSAEQSAADLVFKVKDMNARLEELTQRMAQLRSTPVSPLGGGAMATVGELAKAFESPGYKGYITRLTKQIESDEELLRMEQELQRRMAEEAEKAEAAAADLAQQMAETNARLEAALAERPPGSAAFPETWSEERRQWEAEYREMVREQQQLGSQLQEARSRALTGNTEDLKEKIAMRRRQLEGPMRGDLQFWKEWSMDNIDQVTQALRQHGQRTAAEALEQLMSLLEQRRDVERKLRGYLGKQAAGAQLELPQGAEGTMVDFLAAEQKLGEIATTATDRLDEQRKTLDRLVSSLDDARMAAGGLGEAERQAVSQMEAQARREIRKRTPAKLSLEETGEVSREVLGRLALEVRETTEAMQKALSQPVTEEAEAQAKGLLRVWQWISDQLVGHSVVPDMVADINAWLRRIGVLEGGESLFEGIVAESEEAAERIVAALSEIARALSPEQLAERAAALETEIRGINTELAALLTRTGEVDPVRASKFEDAKRAVLRVRGDDPETRAMLEQGYLPKGFGLAGETRFDKEGRVRGETEETADEWYKVLQTGFSAIERFAQEDSERITELGRELARKTAELATIGQVQAEHAVQAYEQAVAELSEAGDDAAIESAFERQVSALEELERQSQDTRSATEELAQAIGEEIALEEAARRKAERAAARTPEARAEAEERIAAARATAKALEHEERRRTEAVKTAGRVEVETAKAANRERVEAAKATTQAAVEAEKRLTEESRTAGRERVEAAKAQSRERIEDAKAETKERAAAAQAMKAAAVEEEKRETARVRAEIQARKRASTEAAMAQRQTNKLTGDAQQLAAQLGLSWAYVSEEMEDSGATLSTVVGALRRVQQQQRQAERGAREYGERWEGMVGFVRRFTAELSQIRRQQDGLVQFYNDVDRVTRSVQFHTAAVSGALTVAARDYVQLAKQTDVASRSLMLSQELTRDLRQEVVSLSAEMALLDPQATARGVTIWAQATGQAVVAHEDLNRVLDQTVPLQQLAALAQEDIVTVTDGTAATLRQFGLELDDVTRVVAVFNKTADDTLAGVGDMAEAFKYVGPQAKEMGESLEEVSAAVGIMADQNIRGSQAGRAYRQMLISLIDPTKEARSLLGETFGTEQPFFEEGQFVGMAQVIDMLAAATEGATQEQKELLLATLFTSNALPGVTALVEAQTEARERGVNVIRAEAKLLEGVVDEEVRAYAQMKEAAEGTTLTLQGAVELWERQLEDWEESDVKRVQEAEMRWKAFWLAIGETVVNQALPALERASEILAWTTSFVQDHPEFGSLIAVAAGVAGLATLVRVVTGVARAVTGVRMVAQAYERTLAGQQAASETFQTRVVSAAEQFSAIVRGAAESAAATEQAGAEAEVATEQAGAETETATEVAGAKTETAIETAGARQLWTKALLPLMLGDLGSRGLTGQGLAGWFTDREGRLAGEARASMAEGLTAQEIERLIAQATADLQFVQQQSGWDIPSMFDPAYQERLAEIFDGKWWYAMSGTALVDKTKELETALAGYQEALFMANAVEGSSAISDAFSDAGVHAARAGRDVQGLTEDLYNLGQTADETAGLTEAETRAVDLYIEYLQKQEEATEDFAQRLQDLAGDLEEDLADLRTDYLDDRAAIIADFQESEQQSWAEHYRRMQEQAEEFQKRLRRLDEDHADRMHDIALRRDAAGAYREIRDYEKQRERMIEDYGDQRDEAQRSYEAQRAQRQAQHAQQLADLQAQYEAERAERLADYQERRQELQDEHDQEMRDLRMHYLEKINAELGFYQRSQAVQNFYYAAMLRDTQFWMERQRQTWEAYVSSLPTPSGRSQGWAATGDRYGAMADAYAAGGYVRNTGPALVHQGEFVLDRQTTRQMEAHTGRLSQAGVLGALGGNTVSLSMPLSVQIDGSGGRLDAADLERRLRRVQREAVELAVGKVAAILDPQR